MTSRQIKLVENYIQRQVKSELAKSTSAKNRLTEESSQTYHGVVRVRGNSTEMISAFLKLFDAKNLKSMLEKGKPPVKNEIYTIKMFKYTEFGWEDAE